MQQLDHQELHTTAEAGQDSLKSYITSLGLSYEVKENEGALTEISFQNVFMTYTFMFDGDVLMAVSPAL